MRVNIIRVFSAVLVLLLVGACETTTIKDVTDVQQASKDVLAGKGIPFTTTAYITAAKNGKTEIVKDFLAGGMDVDASVDGTALIAAAASKNLDMVKLLVENGANVNETNYLGTALTTAVYVSNFDIANYLIANGADVNLPGGDGTNAIVIASKNGEGEMIELLVKNGANVNYKFPGTGLTALVFSSASGHLAAVEQLIKGGANVNFKDNSGTTVLDWAMLGNYIEVAKVLIENGASVKDNTVMIASLCHGDHDFVGYLINHGVDVNGYAFNKMPFLVWCAKNDLPKSAETLIKYGADTKVTDSNGNTALDYALINKEYDLVKILDPSIDVSKLPKKLGDPNLVASKLQFNEDDLSDDGDDSATVVPGQQQDTNVDLSGVETDINKRLSNVKDKLTSTHGDGTVIVPGEAQKTVVNPGSKEVLSASNPSGHKLSPSQNQEIYDPTSK